MALWAQVRSRDWRLQLAAILVGAVALRAIFFVGFALGDDLGYLAHVDRILGGSYPPLNPQNQYAYRPLLLLLFAAGVGLFGATDLGVVAPVMVSAIVTTALVFVLVRRLIDPAAAWWAAIIFAFEPFNVVNSTTMTNDVILSCLILAAYTAFLIGDVEPDRRLSRRWFVAAGGLMVAAFLVKITMVPALAALGLYSLVCLARTPWTALSRHAPFYLTFLAGLTGICAAYAVLTGDWLWQFKAERFYYEVNKPDWYLAGHIDYASLMWAYPRSLFGRSGLNWFRFFEHGLLFWFAVPAVVFWLSRRDAVVVKFLITAAVVMFAFFEFYPQYLTPRYLPLVRQERYLEMLVPAASVVVGTALHRLSRRHAGAAVFLLVLLLGDFVLEAARRSTMYNDSQQDVRELAGYVRSTIAGTGRPLFADLPARNALTFYLRDVPVQVRAIEDEPEPDVRGAYFAVGGSRSFWWSPGLIVDVRHDTVPAHWVLTWERPAPRTPWRRSNVRVYCVSDIFADSTIDPLPAPPGPTSDGLRLGLFPRGFGGPELEGVAVTQIPDLNNSSEMPASHLEWTAWLRATSGHYTFETTSDDGSWIYVNDRLILDNGGTHPARTARGSVNLGNGWYRFRVRYEDTGGDRFLRLRAFRSGAPLDLSSPGLLVRPAD